MATLISRIEMFIEMLSTIAKRSTCLRKKVGSILVKDNRVIAISYNGVLPGEDPKTGLTDHGTSKTVHAEANIIAFCAKNGIATNDTVLYVSLSPCQKCAELIVQSGIREVVYVEEYRDRAGIELLENQRILCHQYIK